MESEKTPKVSESSQDHQEEPTAASTFYKNVNDEGMSIEDMFEANDTFGFAQEDLKRIHKVMSWLAGFWTDGENSHSNATCKLYCAMHNNPGEVVAAEICKAAWEFLHQKKATPSPHVEGWEDA